MARTKIDVITCDRCARRLEEADVRAIEFSIYYYKVVITTNPPRIPSSSVPQPTKYNEVCARCDKLLRRLAADAATPSKPGRPRKKEKEDD